MDRRLRNLLLAAAALILAVAAAVFGGGALVARRECGKLLRLPPSATLEPETVARPGDPARAVAEFMLPWGVEIAEARVDPGAETVASGPPRIGTSFGSTSQPIKAALAVAIRCICGRIFSFILR